MLRKRAFVCMSFSFVHDYQNKMRNEMGFVERKKMVVKSSFRTCILFASPQCVPPRPMKPKCQHIFSGRKLISF